MQDDIPLVEVIRGGRVECTHRGHAVVCDAQGGIVDAWGNPDAMFYPRSSAKMIQALPLVESGAADAHSLRTDQIALACASHIGAAYHTDPVRAWLSDLGLADDDFRCGPQEPSDRDARHALIRAGETPCQYHNNCSGKHCGFLTLNRHLGGGPDYIDAGHPVQQAVKAAFEDVTGMDSPGYGIDGCSAPNYATTTHGLARAMASFASASGGNAREDAQVRLREAMMTHPELISGEGRACTELMRACEGRAAIKGGADGVYIAILPELRMGIALKITDGASRASEPAVAAILHRLGVIPDGHPALDRWMRPEQRNFAGRVTGRIQPVEALVG